MSADKSKGLFDKYEVDRNDGKPIKWCFVLEDKDPLAPKVLEMYAMYRRAHGCVALADDLDEKAAAIRESMRCEACGVLSYDDTAGWGGEDCDLCPNCMKEAREVERDM